MTEVEKVAKEESSSHTDDVPPKRGRTDDYGFDGDDCIDFNSNYPNCTFETPYRIGDGVCNFSAPYNTEECKWEGGDCIDCNKSYPDDKYYFLVDDGNTTLNSTVDSI